MSSLLPLNHTSGSHRGAADEGSQYSSLFHFNNGPSVTAELDSLQSESCIGPACHQVHYYSPAIIKLSLLLCYSSVSVCLIHHLRIKLPSSPVHIILITWKPLPEKPPWVLDYLYQSSFVSAKYKSSPPRPRGLLQIPVIQQKSLSSKGLNFPPRR